MSSYRKLLQSVTLLVLAICLQPVLAAVNPEWTAAQKPFRIAGDLYYVGSRDLAAYLVTTPAGNLLINANLESSPPQLRASVEALGFRWADTRILLNSQAHFDHAAGSAAILRETGAKMMVMEGDAEVVETGDAHDFGGSALRPYPPAPVVRVLKDGDTVVLGGVVLTARRTAGHSRGCTTWTMQVNDGGRKRNVVIVGGLSALEDYRLMATPGHPASYPGIEQDFKHSFAVLRTLPCDLFLGAHGSYFGMQGKLARLPQEGTAVWIDPAGYQQAISDAERQFKEHLAKERRRNERGR